MPEYFFLGPVYDELSVVLLERDGQIVSRI